MLDYKWRGQKSLKRCKITFEQPLIKSEIWNSLGLPSEMLSLFTTKNGNVVPQALGALLHVSIL